MTLREEGERVRREVLGDEHVDAAAAATTPSTAEFQAFLTEWAWGAVWSRPGLDRRSRSLLTIAALVVGGYEEELRLHLRAAIRNGLSRQEIKEALIHMAPYAGVPAVNTAFRLVVEVLGADLELPA